MKDAKKIISELLELQEKYSFEKRTIVTADRYEQIALTGLVSTTDYNNEILREPLLEHVGHLPVMTAYLHQYIEHKDKVNLGDALIMLAVHDIGETVTGDVMAYTKTKEHEVAEAKAAKALLPDYLDQYYQEFEAQETYSAKYAKSMDVLAPTVHSMYWPAVKLENFKQLGFDLSDIPERQAQYFEWDPVLKEIFSLCYEHFVRFEKGESLIFKSKD